MPPPFRKVTLQQFETLLRDFPFERRVTAVHMHHTWRPNHQQFDGHTSIVSMWRFHTAENGWADIAQHLTIAPDGGLWLGRNWNMAPASAGGHNGTRAAGPFMFEMVGDFDRGRDRFDGAQKDAALRVVALVQDRFDLPVASLRFHNQMSSKSCPGSGISYEQTLREVQELRASEGLGASREAAVAGDDSFLFGDDDAGEGAGSGVPAGDGSASGAAAAEDGFLPGDEDVSTPAQGPAGAAAPAAADPFALRPEGEFDAAGEKEEGVDELVLALLRSGLDSAPGAEPPDAEPAEKEGAAPDSVFARDTFAGGREGLFGGGEISVDILEALRPHVINLKRGRLSGGGRYQTSRDDVDAIFGEDLERAVAGKGPGDPLRIVVWAHGGLIDEVPGLLIAHKHVRWWQANGVYPLYFVWETGLLPALGRLLTGRSGGEEAAFGRSVANLGDKAIEVLSRKLQGPAIWGDMKQSARLSIDREEGGAAFVAGKLAEFCRRHAGAVELHAVGHSAGSIFHASFLPTALEQGVPGFKTLALLAPAIRVDRFHERLAPLVGEGKPIEKLSLYTMNRLRELADTCMGVYRKSLLYLIYYGLEDRRETPILGLEDSLRSDPDLKTLFGLGDRPRRPGIEVIWSKTAADAAPRSRSMSTSHGGFDDDPATMDSVLRRILDRDVIRVGYGSARPAEAPVDSGFVPGEESLAAAGAADGHEEEYGVDFDVLDAFERAAELDGDAGLALEGLEAAGQSIAFGPNARETDVTEFSRQVLCDIMQRAGCGSVTISSTSRDPANQARVMFNNLEKFGVAHQKKLYGPSGDQVIEVYRRAKAAGDAADRVKARMAAEIVRIGPTRVSRHAADPKVLNVFDVAPSSVAGKAAFARAVRAEPRVAKFLEPPADPGFHLEIPQPRTDA